MKKYKINKDDLTKLIDYQRTFWDNIETDEKLDKKRYDLAEKIAKDSMGSEGYRYRILDTINLLIGAFGFDTQANDEKIYSLFEYLGFEVI